MRMIKYLVLFLSLSLFYACDNEFIESGEFDRHLEYFPLSSGKVWEYTYDSTIYLNSGSRKDSSSGFLKLEVGEKDSFETFQLLKSKRKSLAQAYEVFRSERISIDNNKLITTDNNLKFINLVFPPTLGTTWDGNIFFNDNIEILIGGDPYMMYKDWEYKITTVDTTIVVEGQTYSDVIKVQQVNNENAIELRSSEEYYAKGIGLILKRQMILNTQKVGSMLPWSSKAESGLIYTQKLTSHN